MPFEIPENWAWCRLGKIAQHNTGKTLDKGRNTGTLHNYITTSNLYWNKFDLIELRKMLIGNTELDRCTATKGDLLICEGGDAGRSAIWKSEQPICFQNHIHRVRPYKIDITFLYYFIQLIYLNGNIKQYLKGVGIQSLSGDALRSITLPLPPLHEQHRIVSVIESAFALIDEIETTKLSLEQFIKQAKSKVLDLAIRGKLVPQDPNDEPASVLLERVRNEQKTKKPNADILHYPFEIPESWRWCRLGEIFKIIMGQSPEGNSISNDNTGVEFHQGKLCFSKQYLEKSSFYTNNPTRIAESNSLLLCVRAPVGIVNITMRKICIGRGLCALQASKEMDIIFAYYWLKTLETSFNQKATGSTFTAISGDVIRNELIPIPPLSEQKRIVTQIETIFKTLDSIQENL